MKAFALLAAALFSFAALAEERVPVSTSVEYPAQALVKWNYVESNVVRDGVRDHDAYLELSFSQERCDNRLISTRITVKAEGLVWDSEFKQVLFLAQGKAPVVCAKRTAFGGFKKLTQNCNLFGDLQSDGRAQPVCGGRLPAVYNGELIIQN